MERIRRKCGFSQGVDISSNGSSGGLSIGWKDTVSISIRSFSLHHIDIFVLNERDFNEILSLNEKKGGLLRNEWQMQNLRDALGDCELFDLGYNGNWYTWEWGRTSANNIRARLDRGVANSAWDSLFPDYRLDHLPHSFSDHCPLLLDTCANLGQSQQFWHFRFEASWLLESSCEAEVEHLWSTSVGSVPDRLLEVSLGLDRWFRKIRRDKRLSVRELQKRITDLKGLKSSGPHFWVDDAPATVQNLAAQDRRFVEPP
ncbi:hypothetical protein V6N11_057995 [Hibiscus sabdariffa]|uniref:Reverse transcriptase n=1 Tax=Hibiscus sabdariffa TaxID=183260 RepID=A0ABR2P481_9ROSI